QSTLQIRDARVISQATVPGGPSYPKSRLIAVLGLVFGLGCGIGTAFLLEALKSGFASPQEIEQALELPVLASVPLLAPRDLVIDGEKLPPLKYLVAKPLSRFSEAIRST